MIVYFSTAILNEEITSDYGKEWKTTALILENIRKLRNAAVGF
jgi:hypothetical protein